MKILGSKILFAGLLVLGLSAMLQPRQSLLTAQQSAPQSSKTSMHSFQGVWAGRFPFDDAQVLMYINGAGDLFGSRASNDGLHFYQITGKHRGNAFHIISTPPSGMDPYHYGAEVRDGTARWENSPDRFSVVIVGTVSGHDLSYTFKRLKRN